MNCLGEQVGGHSISFQWDFNASIIFVKVPIMQPESLYTTFARYPLKPTLRGCPCCVSEADKSRLHVAPLRELTSEDLSRYAWKAMSTFGDEEDFKHFLPRMLELMALGDSPVDDDLLLHKLEYAKWRTWPAEEVQAVEAFLLEWWQSSLMVEKKFYAPLFEALIAVLGMQAALKAMECGVADAGFHRLPDMVLHYLSRNARNQLHHLRQFGEEDKQMLLNWLMGLRGQMEEGFAYHVDKEDALASMCSDAEQTLRLAETP
jgi:hypothetical protein